MIHLDFNPVVPLKSCMFTGKFLKSSEPSVLGYEVNNLFLISLLRVLAKLKVVKSTMQAAMFSNGRITFINMASKEIEFLDITNEIQTGQI